MVLRPRAFIFMYAGQGVKYKHGSTVALTFDVKVNKLILNLVCCPDANLLVVCTSLIVFEKNTLNYMKCQNIVIPTFGNYPWRLSDRFKAPSSRRTIVNQKNNRCAMKETMRFQNILINKIWSRSINGLYQVSDSGSCEPLICYVTTIFHFVFRSPLCSHCKKTHLNQTCTGIAFV